MRESSAQPQVPSRLEIGLLVALGLASLVSTLAGVRAERPAPRRDDLLVAAASGYQSFWSEVDSVAQHAAKTLGAESLATASSLELFERATDALPRSSRRPWALYLVDPDSQARAWSGEGLLHPLRAEDLAESGRTFRASLTTVTVLAVAPIEGHPGWRAVAGLSLPSSRLPFPLPARAHLQTHWGLSSPGAAAPAGRAEIALDRSPTLLIDEAEMALKPTVEGRWWSDPLTWLGSLILVTAIAFRRRLGWLTAPCVAAGTVAWGLTAGTSLSWLLALALSVVAVFVSGALALRRKTVMAPIWSGALGAALLLVVAFVVHRMASPDLLDLAEHFAAGGQAWVARAILFLVALAWLGCLARGGDSGGTEGRTRPLWLGASAIAVGAMLADFPWLAGLLLLVGGSVLARGLAARSIRRRPLTLGALAVIAALAAASASEIAHRTQLRHHLGATVLAALAPPTRAETGALRDEVAEHFENLDLSDLATSDIFELEDNDLAFELWRRSPLARGRAVSAVALRGPDEVEYLFSFGVPLGSTGRPQIQSRERPFDAPVWDFALLNEVVPVALGGELWGDVEYWLLVRPGFRLAEQRLRDVEGDLLRGGPAGRGAVQRQVAPASFAHYSNSRLARISPWLEPPELPEDVLETGEGFMRTPDGPSWVWTSREAEGTRAVFLSRLSPLAAFERVGIQALGSLMPPLILLLVVLALRLSRSTFRRRLRDLWRSYASRLVLVFSLLVLVPAVIVDVLVLRVIRERAEAEQLSEARGALVAAQRVLGEYSASLEPGVGLDTVFDDDLLSWLAGVLGHDVNLYWTDTSELLASSRQELFAAGLLPRRVPGEIYAELRLRGKRLASRLQNTGATEYTELYAPLTAPGEALEDAAYFLSIPLLAQQEQVAGELEALRHKIVLATTLLVLLLVALGARLAASFTAPLEEIVQGTQRIATGAEQLGLAPKELELATLVEAIDRMAERIAVGRQRLLLEKQVVERMVDNITAAVVSIDGSHRVLMQNKVAFDLLGTQVGVPIETSMAETDNLGKVLAGLRRSEVQGGAETVSLTSGEEDDLRQWSLIWVPIPGEGEPSALIVVEDVTEVVRSQRLQAWAEMARMIAHEIKNPLTPIQLSAEHMREVRQRDPSSFDKVFDQCINNILHHVEELRSIASEFSTYSRIPRIEPVTGNLTASVRELVAGYQVAQPSGISVTFTSEGDDVHALFDGKLLRRALRNLIENAIRAVDEGGAVEVTVGRELGAAVVRVLDEGPGVEPDQLGRIFDPYFSTHDTGTGLGLPIARRIIEEHGGEIHARNRSHGGLEVRVVLPEGGVPGRGRESSTVR